MDLRQHAMRYVGQPIVAHHVNGTVHRGILHSVTNDGMYIRPYGAGYASSDSKAQEFAHADGSHQDMESELVFWGFGLGFLPWLALSGFWGGGLWW